MIIAHLKRSLRETFPTRASEWALALMLFNWSLVLTVNADLFASTPSFDPLAHVLSQETWALLCLIAGGGRLVMLAVNGSWRRSPHLRAIGALISCFFWLLISIGFAQSGRIGTALAIYPVLLLLDAYNVIRAAGDAGSADRIHTGPSHNGTDT